MAEFITESAQVHVILAQVAVKSAQVHKFSASIRHTVDLSRKKNDRTNERKSIQCTISLNE
ncbi:hypothetical protein [Lentibacillus persicus]|uniref:hypothetical protein n=1 Tax=Lentibacillus persicus TaxID=640948 RepID=UPI001C4319A5|nr:hypothetical protein [Lentibacillus persicus]